MSILISVTAHDDCTRLTISALNPAVEMDETQAPVEVEEPIPVIKVEPIEAPAETILVSSEPQFGTLGLD